MYPDPIKATPLSEMFANESPLVSRDYKTLPQLRKDSSPPANNTSVQIESERPLASVQPPVFEGDMVGNRVMKYWRRCLRELEILKRDYDLSQPSPSRIHERFENLRNLLENFWKFYHNEMDLEHDVQWSVMEEIELIIDNHIAAVTNDGYSPCQNWDHPSEILDLGGKNAENTIHVSGQVTGPPYRKVGDDAAVCTKSCRRNQGFA